MNCHECGTYVATGMRMCPICHIELMDPDATTQALVLPHIAPLPDQHYLASLPRRQFSFGGMNALYLKLAIATLLIFASLTTIIGTTLLIHQTRSTAAAYTNAPIQNAGKGIAVAPTLIATVPAPVATVTMPTATALPALQYALNCGGYQSGAYRADTNGNPLQTTQTSDAIDTSMVPHPAAPNVYQTERYGDSTYTISLTDKATYLVRLHFAEIHFNQPGERQFDVYINNTRVLENFDIVAQAGGSRKAIVQEFTVTADEQGKIVLRFLAGAHNEATCSGFEIFTIGY